VEAEGAAMRAASGGCAFCPSRHAQSRETQRFRRPFREGAGAAQRVKGTVRACARLAAARQQQQAQ